MILNKEKAKSSTSNAQNKPLFVKLNSFYTVVVSSFSDLPRPPNHFPCTVSIGVHLSPHMSHILLGI